MRRIGSPLQSSSSADRIAAPCGSLRRSLRGARGQAAAEVAPGASADAANGRMNAALTPGARLEGRTVTGIVSCMRAAAVAIAALALAPAAAAWTTLDRRRPKHGRPVADRHAGGTELVSFDAPVAGTISVSREQRAPKTSSRAIPIAGRTQLVQQPNGAIQLYFPNAQGVGRMTSTDDGQTWTGPIQTQSHTTGPVEGAAVAPDGTPYFSQDGTGFVNVFRGLNGESVKNVFPRCCGYASRLRSTRTALVQVAFYSNADPDGDVPLRAARRGPHARPRTTPLKPTAQHDDASARRRPLRQHVPRVGARLSDATGVTVVPFRGGSPAGDGVTSAAPSRRRPAHGAHRRHAGPALGRLDAVAERVHAARSRSHGLHFGAAVSVPVPGTAYQVSAAGSPASPGSVDVLVNTGATLVEQALQPGLSVKRHKKTKKVGKKTSSPASRRRSTTASASPARRSRSAAGRSTRTPRARRRCRQAQGRLQRPATSAPRSECR